MLRYIMLFFCSILFTGCASFDVNYDYDQTVDFASIKTYDWMPVSKKITRATLSFQKTDLKQMR